MFLSDIRDNGQKHVFLSVLNLIITDGIDFQAFLLIIFFRSNDKSLQPMKLEDNGHKKTKKARGQLSQPLSPQSGSCVWGERMAWRGERNSKGRSGG
jgi:hypothetical protein